MLLWDGTCAFCRRWIERWRRATGDAVDYATYQEEASRFPERPRERFERAVQLVEPDGRWSEGAEAVFRSLAHGGRGGPLWLYRFLPGFAPTSRWCYRVVAGHRPSFDRLTCWIWGDHVVPPGNAFTTWLFFRLLAAIYAVAFLSLWVQILGLAGSHGILPARDTLQAIRQYAGAGRFWLLPTLCWISASDGFLVTLCGAGTVLAVLLAAGVAPLLTAALAWVVYLSLATVCRDFLWFQWDALLLEAGFLAIFLAPRRWWSHPRRDPPPPTAARGLMRWLLFRLMFSSGAVKLTSGDPTWHNLTALRYHYQTQPLPPWPAWFAHQLPPWFQTFSCAMLFAIEGIAPFFLFTPRRIRFAAAGAIAVLQVLISITGNYSFFNLLTLALCLLVLDDGVWPRAWRPSADSASVVPYRSSLGWILAAAVFLTSLVPTLDALHWPTDWLGPFNTTYRLASPFRVVDRYGLFAVMTTERPEIILEGSDDGRTWRTYEFRWKPGDPKRRPEFVAPHQPRLDWQMWFAALSDFRREPWFLSFCQRLLEGSKPVTALLAFDPFPKAPPRFLRAVVYDYRFTDAAERRRGGAWWRREPKGLYCPVLALEGGRLVAVTPLPSGP